MFDQSRVKKARTKQKNGRDSSIIYQERAALDLVEFSIEQIVFKHRGSPNIRYISNTELKIINKGSRQICFKIRSTNPQRYSVYPHQGQIQEMRMAQINVRLLIAEGYDCSKIKNDRFEIVYGLKPQLANKSAEYSMSKKIRARVAYYSTQQDQKSAEIHSKSVKEENLYDELLRKNEDQIEKVECQILKIQNQKGTNNLLTKQFLLFIGLIGFLFGYYFS